MLSADQIDFKELKNTVRVLNETGLLKKPIRTIAVSRESLLRMLEDSIYNNENALIKQGDVIVSKIPTPVILFLNKVFGPDEVKEQAPVEEPQSSKEEAQDEQNIPQSGINDECGGSEKDDNRLPGLDSEPSEIHSNVVDCFESVKQEPEPTVIEEPSLPKEKPPVSEQTKKNLDQRFHNRGMVSRYGSGLNSQAGRLDELLWVGGRVDEMAKELECGTKRIYSHIRHLETKKGIVFAYDEDLNMETGKMVKIVKALTPEWTREDQKKSKDANAKPE